MIPTDEEGWRRTAKCLLNCVEKQFWQMAERRRHYNKCHVSVSKELKNSRGSGSGSEGGTEMSTRVHQSNELSLSVVRRGWSGVDG